MSEKFAHITKSVCIQSMSRLIRVFENLLKGFHINIVNFAETLSKKTVKFFVCSLLCTTICEIKSWHVKLFEYMCRQCKCKEIIKHFLFIYKNSLASGLVIKMSTCIDSQIKKSKSTDPSTNIYLFYFILKSYTRTKIQILETEQQLSICSLWL